MRLADEKNFPSRFKAPRRARTQSLMRGTHQNPASAKRLDFGRKTIPFPLRHALDSPGGAYAPPEFGGDGIPENEGRATVCHYRKKDTLPTFKLNNT